MKFYAPLIVLCFIAFDVLTGWLKAWETGQTNSSIMRVGLIRKLAEILAILFAYGCEYAFPYVGINISLPLGIGVSMYITAMEIASIIENLGEINPNLRKVLAKYFDSAKIGIIEEDKGKHEK